MVLFYSTKQSSRCIRWCRLYRRCNDCRRNTSGSRSDVPPTIGLHAETARDARPGPRAAQEYRPLPLPPLMNPALKNKKKTRKLRPTQDLTPLQRELQNNPFAHALATPLRYCAITDVRLPNFFLLQFELVAHPETGKPVLIPRNLARPARPAPSESDAETGGADAADGPESKGRASAKPPARPGTGSPGTYAMATQSILRSLEPGPTSGRKDKARRHRLVDFRLAGRFPLQGQNVKLVPHLSDVVLRLLRLRVISELAYVASQKNRGCIKDGSTGLDPAASGARVGCLLWLGPPDVSVDSTTPNEREEGTKRYPQWDPMHGPPPYTVFRTSGPAKGPVVVYNLPRLLGREHLGTLRQKLGEYGAEEVLVLVATQLAVRPQIWLWKLENYFSQPAGPIVHSEEGEEEDDE